MSSSQLADSYDPLGAHLDDPYPFYAQARQVEPVFHSPRLRAWVVTRYEDVDAVLKDPETFSSVNSLRPVRDLYPTTFAAFAEGYPPKPDHVTSDAEVHRRMRAPYARRLTAPGVRVLEPGIRARADALVDAFADDGQVELIEQFASPLPVETASELFGIDAADVPTARAGTEAMFRLGSVDLPETDEVQAARQYVALQHLIARYVRARHAEPTGDLVSDVVAALAPGEGELTFDQEAEIVGSLAGTLGAGHITTTDTLGSAVRLLLDHPDQWELVREKPELIPGAVEEVMRFDSPVPTIFRKATREVTVAGVTVPEGADVLLAFASANRDESRFENPDRFDVTRPPTRHFGFGAGVHTCVGALLARTQSQIALRVLGERLPDLRLATDQTIRVRPSINVRGPLALELVW